MKTGALHSMFSSLKHIERKKHKKTHVDEAHNTHFDLQNSPYITLDLIQ